MEIGDYKSTKVTHILDGEPIFRNFKLNEFDGENITLYFYFNKKFKDRQDFIIYLETARNTIKTIGQIPYPPPVPQP